MPKSLSPSTGSTILICQAQHSVPKDNGMRLPSMNELLSKTGHLSEQSRAIRRLNSPSRNSQISSEEFIDLTSDSPPDSFSLPSLRYYPDTNEPSTSVSSPDYFTFFGMPPTTARRSRESTARREYAVKRRRGNGLDNILTSISPGLTSHTPYQIDSIDFLDLTTPQKDTFNTSSLKRKASEDLVTKHEHDNDFVEAQTVQDKHLSDTIKAQAGVAQAASKLSQLTCIICMDNMENMTATICGHVFCHTCIMEALLAGEHRGEGRQTPKCPMCRTKLRRKVFKGPPEIVPLTLKLMKRSDKTKGKQKEILWDDTDDLNTIGYSP